MLQALDRLPEAEKCQRENVAIRRRLVQLDKRADLAHHLAWALGHHGLLLQAQGRLSEAEQCLRESVAILRRLVEVEKRAELADSLAIALRNHGIARQALGRLAPAEQRQREQLPADSGTGAVHVFSRFAERRRRDMEIKAAAERKAAHSPVNRKP